MGDSSSKESTEADTPVENNAEQKDDKAEDGGRPTPAEAAPPLDLDKFFQVFSEIGDGLAGLMREAVAECTAIMEQQQSTAEGALTSDMKEVMVSKAFELKRDRFKKMLLDKHGVAQEAFDEATHRARTERPQELHRAAMLTLAAMEEAKEILMAAFPSEDQGQSSNQDAADQKGQEQ